jgi:predicted P-loop ATPase
MKIFLSIHSDTVRLCYDKFSTSIPRQCIFIGTINPSHGGQYLRDTTGNRRFWPVAVGGMKLNDLLVDVDQIWAEAVEAYRRGEQWYITDPFIIDLAVLEQQKRQTVDPWEELLGIYLSTHPNDSVNIKQLFDYALGIKGRVTQVDLARVVTILDRLGWVRSAKAKEVGVFLRVTDD